VALAATWDPSLAQQYGQVIGAEEYGKGASANLGPTVNIDRDPRWGRSFEALSEDPALNATLDVPEIAGVQSQDVESQVKHLAVYNQETYRNTLADNVIIDPRTEQEIYLPAFHLPLSSSGGSIAVVGPAADASPIYAGGGSAYVIPSGTVSPLAGIKAAAGSGTNVSYSQGLPVDTALPPIPSSNLSPAYAPTPFGGSYTGTLTAPETGTYVLAITNPCGCYTSTYLSLDGKQIIDNPSTPPVHTYSVAVQLTAGKTYTLSISGASSQLLWGTPSALAPGLKTAADAAKSASVAVVVVSDDTQSEATDRLSLNLPSAQDELISAVAAANPHTVVVINAGAPVAMPWLPSVAGVVDAWYPGQTNGTSLASVLFGQTDPGGHLPVTFPTSLSQVPASTTAQFPGNGTTVQYSEGINVGYRWYDAKDLTPMFPFGFGLSYTQFAFSNLIVQGPSVVDGTRDVRVAATVTNTGKRAGSEVAQLYLADPSASGEPPRQLAGFQRVNLAPGASTRVSFTVTPQAMSWWDDAANGWTQAAGTYGVYVGDSSALAGLPLRGSFSMATTAGARQVTLSAPSTMQPGQAAAVRVTLTAAGNATLNAVRLALQLPEGWTAKPTGPTNFGSVAPGQAPAVTFMVTPPSYAPNASAVVHATATTGDWLREAGVTVTVSG
jgi:beta-glucosidase